MNSHYITVVVQWLASVHSKCKDDGSNPVWMGSITLDIFFVNIPSLVMEIKVSKLSLGNPIIFGHAREPK